MSGLNQIIGEVVTKLPEVKISQGESALSNVVETIIPRDDLLSLVVNKQVRNNFTAGQNIKNAITKGVFEYASEEDRRILLSLEDSDLLRKVKVRSKTGDILYILKHPTENPTESLFKVLNNKGQTLKEAIIPDNKLSKITIIDDFSNLPTIEFFESEGRQLTHGQAVHRYAQRSNPFANYELIDATKEGSYVNPFLNAFYGEGKTIEDLRPIFDSILEKTKEGDIISISLAKIMSISHLGKILNLELKPENLLKNKGLVRKNLEEVSRLPANEFIERLEKNNLFDKSVIGLENITNDEKKAIAFDIQEMLINSVNELKAIEKLADKKAKIFIAAGNEGKGNVNLLLFANNVKGVGSLTKNKTLSDFNASGSLVKYFEIGEYEPKITVKGINYTGKEGTDIAFDTMESAGLFKKYVGKPLSQFLISEEDLNKVMSSENAMQELCLKYKDKLIKAKDLAKVYPDEDIKKVYEELGDKYVLLKGAHLFDVDMNGNIIPALSKERSKGMRGTSFSTPIKAANIALQDWLHSCGLIE